MSQANSQSQKSMSRQGESTQLRSPYASAPSKRAPTMSSGSLPSSRHESPSRARETSSEELLRDISQGDTQESRKKSPSLLRSIARRDYSSTVKSDEAVEVSDRERQGSRSKGLHDLIHRTNSSQSERRTVSPSRGASLLSSLSKRDVEDATFGNPADLDEPDMESRVQDLMDEEVKPKMSLMSSLRSRSPTAKSYSREKLGGAITPPVTESRLKTTRAQSPADRSHRSRTMSDDVPRESLLRSLSKRSQERFDEQEEQSPVKGSRSRESTLRSLSKRSDVEPVQDEEERPRESLLKSLSRKPSKHVEPEAEAEEERPRESLLKSLSRKSPRYVEQEAEPEPEERPRKSLLKSLSRKSPRHVEPEAEDDIQEERPRESLLKSLSRKSPRHVEPEAEEERPRESLLKSLSRRSSKHVEAESEPGKSDSLHSSVEEIRERISRTKSASSAVTKRDGVSSRSQSPEPSEAKRSLLKSLASESRSREEFHKEPLEAIEKEVLEVKSSSVRPPLFARLEQRTRRQDSKSVSKRASDQGVAMGETQEESEFKVDEVATQKSHRSHHSVSLPHSLVDEEKTLKRLGLIIDTVVPIQDADRIMVKVITPLNNRLMVLMGTKSGTLINSPSGHCLKETHDYHLDKIVDTSMYNEMISIGLYFELNGKVVTAFNENQTIRRKYYVCQSHAGHKTEHGESFSLPLVKYELLTQPLEISTQMVAEADDIANTLFYRHIKQSEEKNGVVFRRIEDLKTNVDVVMTTQKTTIMDFYSSWNEVVTKEAKGIATSEDLTEKVKLANIIREALVFRGENMEELERLVTKCISRVEELDSTGNISNSVFYSNILRELEEPETLSDVVGNLVTHYEEASGLVSQDITKTYDAWNVIVSKYTQKLSTPEDMEEKSRLEAKVYKLLGTMRDLNRIHHDIEKCERKLEAISQLFLSKFASEEEDQDGI